MERAAAGGGGGWARFIDKSQSTAISEIGPRCCPGHSSKTIFMCHRVASRLTRVRLPDWPPRFRSRVSAINQNKTEMNQDEGKTPNLA